MAAFKHSPWWSRSKQNLCSGYFVDLINRILNLVKKCVEHPFIFV